MEEHPDKYWEWRKGILATHEEEQRLATGEWLGNDFIGVALPSRSALNRKVLLSYRDKLVEAYVKDVGPWDTTDNNYVLSGERPKAEEFQGETWPLSVSIPDGKGGFRAVEICNGAGIDLFPGTARALGILIGDNVRVDWRFI